MIDEAERENVWPIVLAGVTGCGPKNLSGKCPAARNRNSTAPSSALASCSSKRSIVQRDC